jgi:glycosyltransferase involved in cell wall biosynthesis
MSAPAIVSFSKFTTFSQEIAALESIRVSRRSQITKYPKVSVLVSTLRSDDLSNLLKQLLNQSLPSFELILGLHNLDLNAEHKVLLARLKKRNITSVIRKFDSSFNLGSILTALAKDSKGEFIAKMDDDDYYGPEHLRDLVDAVITTDADVVGRAMNYVYLEPLQLTVRRFAPFGTRAVELWSDWVAGGTILARRDKAEAAGWFGTGSTAVDRFLLSGIINNGGKIWRTFGAGYVYRRTFTFHTYVTNYSKYLNGANEQVVGLWDHPIFGEVKTR